MAAKYRRCWQAARRSGYDATDHCNPSQLDDGKARIQNLDVFDLRIRIQRGGRSSGGRDTTGDPVGGHPDELDLSRMWRPKGGFRNGRALVGHAFCYTVSDREALGPDCVSNPEGASEIHRTRLCFDWSWLYSVERWTKLGIRHRHKESPTKVSGSTQKR